MYNVMIVDDEPVLRKGLISFISWEALDCRVVCEAVDGVEAKNLLHANSIDIVITDIRMPGMDGIALLEYIYANFPHIKTIILTSYADFTYAQSAIKYSVVDFIIKVTATDKIPEAILKAKALIMQRNKKEAQYKLMEEAMNESLSEIREKLIKDVLNGITVNHETLIRHIEKSDYINNNYFILVYEVCSESNEHIPGTQADQNKFISSAKNFLSFSFNDFQHDTFIVSPTRVIAIVGFENEDPSACIQTLIPICNEILIMSGNIMKFSLSIGISRLHTSPLELHAAYREAQEALSENFYCENNISIYTYKIPEQNTIFRMDRYSYAEEIANLLQQGELAKATSILNKMLDAFRNAKEPMQRVKISCMLLISQCYRLLSNYRNDVSEEMGNECDLYKRIHETKSIQHISTLMENIVSSTSELLIKSRTQYTQIVQVVNKYIREQYKSEVNLHSIAGYVHMNTSHLCKIYKKETGESIIDTLNKYRIEIAKKLLKDPVVKIFEVAQEVGIQDPAYFTHVFTKYVGMSPKEFKAKV